MIRGVFKSLIRGPLTALAALIGFKSFATDSPIIEGIDHVYVSTDQARTLHATLRDSLGLPEAWEFGVHGGTASGGISLGNVVLELMAVPEAGAPSLNGLALWPHGTIEDARPKLRLAGLGHARPVRMKSSAGGGWILMGLADFPEANVFLCEYLDAAEVQRHRSRGSTTLASVSGGSLGIIRVSEIVIGTRDPANRLARWRQLAGMTGNGSIITFARGPDVRIVPAERDAVLELTVEVHDPEQAARSWPQSWHGFPLRFVGK